MAGNTQKSTQSLIFLFTTFIILFSVKIDPLFAIDLPDKFKDHTLLDRLNDPASMAFAPDGRLFFGERISGKLRVASYNSLSGVWEVEADPFYTFDVPSSRHRSAGLRGFCFDPNFQQNGYVYAFYMKGNPRHNRVVRIQADPANPNIALSGSEELLISLPFNSSTSSGSHNGGDMLVGKDGYLYFTTGDGWNGGDPVQSLTTFTGKLFRIHTDGSIPEDNPFFTQTSGSYRAIYGLGLRNPYTMALHPETGNIYINDAVGSKKATVYQVRANGRSAGTNFGHDGFEAIGNASHPWTNVSVGGKILVTGGAWYPQNGYWPESYRGSYFAALWGSNSGDAGSIIQVQSETNLGKQLFASNVIRPPRHKPVMTKIGPDGNLYYLLTDYETGEAEIHMIQYTGSPTVAAPRFTPEGGQYDDPVRVQIQSSTPNARVHYTLDDTPPNQNSPLYTGPLRLDTSAIVRATAFATGLQPSNEGVAEYRIGPFPNLPPIANAGPDITAEIFSTVTLNGSNSFDPDGNSLEISETWEQIGGPIVNILDADETVANFTPTLIGTYSFRITVSDIQGDSAVDDVVVTIVEDIPDILDNLVARWTMEEGNGNIIEDYSANSHTGDLEGNTWSGDSPDQSAFSLAFDGNDDRVNIGALDLTGSAMTLCLWFKSDDWGISDARFISKAFGQQDNEHLWMLSTFKGSQLRFRLKTDGNTTTLISPSGTLSTGIWTHVAAVYDGNSMYLYKDGVQVASTSKTGPIDSDPNVLAALGNQPEGAGGGQRPFDGLLDEVRIYGRALSQQEIERVRSAKPLINPDSTPFNQPPMVSWIGPEQGIGYPYGASITLEVGAQDPDGSIEKVHFYWDGALVGEKMEFPYVHSLLGNQAGIHAVHCIAFDHEGATDTTETLTLYVFPKQDTSPPLPEVPAVVYYNFREQSGTRVSDVSHYGQPLDLFIPDPNAVQWELDGLQLLSPTILKSVTPPTKLVEACRESGEITLEAWVTPNNYTQSGPARIMSFSQDPYSRNFTLGQEQNAYEARLRTTRSDYNGRPGLLAPGGTLTLTKTHIVFTRKRDGQAAVYINGTLERSFYRPGDFSNWNSGYAWMLGNELTEDRPWVGTLHQVAVYNVALEEAYIRHRFEQGKPEQTFFALPGGSQRTGNIKPQETLTIYPNPVKGRISISRESITSPLLLGIYDLHGKRVLKPFHLLGKRVELDVKDLSEGIYFLKEESPYSSSGRIFIKL